MVLKTSGLGFSLDVDGQDLCNIVDHATWTWWWIIEEILLGYSKDELSDISLKRNRDDLPFYSTRNGILSCSPSFLYFSKRKMGTGTNVVLSGKYYSVLGSRRLWRLYILPCQAHPKVASYWGRLCLCA
ncbi:hypothetical protein ACFE04_031835 [Oxalis oulophora]